jgi:diguanylate cyclase (GGDEF)-like protein
MASTLREIDLLGRYGGEEFLVITPVDNNNNGIMLYQRICDSVSAQAIKVNDLSISVTISCGMTAYSADNNDQTITELIARADEALYQAKDNGRNQVVFKQVN